jgi:hypothetical protein
MFFWDPASQTFINVADNDKSVLISFQRQKNAVNKHRIVLKLFDTNKYAPGPHPFHYGGFTKRQFVTNDSTNSILCYKFLNAYMLKSETWVRSQTFQLRHHKNCNFDFFYVNYDPKKLKTRRKWRDEDEEELTDHDDQREQEAEEGGSQEERERMEKERENKGKTNNGADCGCCCDEAVQKQKKQKDRAHHGDPDEWDDVTEITPSKRPVKPVKPYRPPPSTKPPTPTPAPPKPTPKPPVRPPKPPVKPPTPTPPPPKEPGKGELYEEFGLYILRPFFLISAVGENRYLDVVDERNIVIKTPNEYDSQKWMFDYKSKTIINLMYKDKSLDITNGGKSNDMQLWKTNGNWFQQFQWINHYLKNVQDNRVLEVKNGEDKEGQDVLVSKITYNIRQKWRLQYVDTYEDQKTSGLYTPYQIHLGRAFIIRSRLPMQRVVTVVGGRNIVIQTHNRSNQNQIFFLDPRTKTIKSVANSGKSLDIQSRGGSSNLQIWNTSARWW